MKDIKLFIPIVVTNGKRQISFHPYQHSNNVQNKFAIFFRVSYKN